MDRGWPVCARRRRPRRGAGRDPREGTRRHQRWLLRFYGYFADREALLEELLTTWERESTDEVLERVEHEGGDAAAKLRRAGALTFSSDRLLPIDLAVRAWSRRGPAVADRLRRVDNQRMNYLRTLFRALCPDAADIEARCVLAFSLIIGDHFIAADHPISRTALFNQAVALLSATAPPTTSARPPDPLLDSPGPPAKPQ